MGRPIKKKFFGNLNLGTAVTTDDGIGGEGISSVITIGTAGSNYSQGAVAVFTAPGLPTGVTATADLTISTPGGAVTAIALTNKGSGYTGTATITITTATGVTASATGNSGLLGANTFTVASVTGIAVGMNISGAATSGKVQSINSGLNRITTTLTNAGTWTNAANLTFTDIGAGAKFITTLTTTEQNALNVSAKLLAKDGGTAILVSDIIKQEASRRYLVKNTDGIGQCTLVASDTPAFGQMNMTATDSGSNTYWVTKLTARRCTLTQRTGSTYEFATGATAGWNITAAATGVVKLGNA